MKPEEILTQVLSGLGLNANELSKKLGYKRPEKLYKILRGQAQAISRSIVYDLLKIYPELNESFLLSGDGNIFKSNSESRTFQNNKIGNYNSGVNKGNQNVVMGEKMDVAMDDEIKYSAPLEMQISKLKEDIDSLKKELKNKDEIIKSKDEIIESKNEIINLYKKQLKG
ncbi:MAG: hypothetical protein N4A71_21885 [Carboxylicivirga sp.]|jgi:valyl-tRNA synthetase|nr:hypothetical protein [Carboxylicivirga sp.]